MTHDELIQRAQALVDGSITLNEFKAWFSYHHPVGSAGQIIAAEPAAMPGEELSAALASLEADAQDARKPYGRFGNEYRSIKDKSADIKNALQLSGFKAIQIQRADYGFGYQIDATYNGKRIQRTITRPEIHLVVDLMRDEADG